MTKCPIKSIGIIGNGVVGKATARCFMEHTDVKVYDICQCLCTHSLDEMLDCELIFICLPTPKDKEKFHCDTSIIDGVLDTIYTKDPTAPLIIRSTVPIGYTAKINDRLPATIHNPEFLTARCSIADAQIPARNIIGYNHTSCDWSAITRNRLSSLYNYRFPSTPIHYLSTNESEAVKLFQNGFFAVKVAWWNECKVLADTLGLEWQPVMNAILADGRISHNHTQVPGPDGKHGFGGECLPKDLSSLVALMIQNNLRSSVGLGALIRNHDDRKRE